MNESKENAPEAHGQELPNGSRLQEFVIETTIGFGGFGITYLAHDTSLGRKVVIKEHMPDMFSFRDVASLTVRPRHTSGEMMENYEWSMGSFTRESEMLASLEHPNIVRILRRFEANGTAYFVMPFVEGDSFDKVIASREAAGGGFSEAELRKVLDPLLDAFSYLHSLGIYHRDVKPGNILLMASGTPVLIDFGAARQQFGAKSMTVIESAGYTPFEQTESRGNVGPWSDLYAMGGVIRKAITFQTPARSADRIRRDPMVGLAGDPQWRDRFSGAFLEAVDRALRVDEEDRWQQAGDWLDDLKRSAVPTNVRVSSEIKGGTQATTRSVMPPPPSAESQFVAPPIPPPASQFVAPPSPPPSAPSGPTNSQPKQLAQDVSRPKLHLDPTPQFPAPARKPLRKKKSKHAGTLIVSLLLLGVAGGAGWYFLVKKPGEPNASKSTVTSAPLARNTALETSLRKPQIKAPPALKVPDLGEWKKLAGNGDSFAQALLGEGLVTGMSGIPKNADEGLAWLSKSSAAKHPLGVFLFAEQQMLGKQAAQEHSLAKLDLGEEQTMFRKAFTLGFEKDGESGGAVWSAALGRAYDLGLGTTENPTKALRLLTSAGKAGHIWSQYVLGGIYETGRGVRPDPRAAIQWYEKAAQAGWPAAQVAMARMLSSGSDRIRDERAALDWAQKAAQSGEARGMAILGELQETGTGGAVDLGQALYWYRTAAEKGDVGAKGHLGRMYMDGKGLDRDDREAFRLLKEAVDQGDTDSCFALGSLYETGSGGQKSLTEAIKCFTTGADAGDPAAKNALAICMEKGMGMPANPAAAARLYQEAAVGGIADAQLRVGLLFMDGKGVKQDKRKGADWLKKAAGQGLPLASFEWGKCLETGIGVPKDERTAFKLYEDAAKADVVDAGFRAGLMLEEGRGTSKNEAIAKLRYKTAAEAGNASAQVNLGILYAQGRGAEQDDKEAVKWYRMAADQNDTDALVLLGMMCEFGCGTTRDPQEAVKYYRKAATQGDAEAAKLVKNLAP